MAPGAQLLVRLMKSIYKENKMPLKTEPFDPAEYLTTHEAWAYLINDALSTGDAGYIADAAGIVARAINNASDEKVTSPTDLT